MSIHDDEAARMCYRKKAMDMSRAKSVVARSPGHLRAYQCPLCSMWHITNNFTDDGVRKTGWLGTQGQTGEAKSSSVGRK